MTSVSYKLIAGCLLGTAVGDSLGLPSEGMSRGRIARRWKGLGQRLIFGKGMISDDTEHTLMVANALLRYPNDVQAFQQALGWKLRWWMLALPAGVGLSTAKAIIRLWLGFPASRSGVKSAGNGAAMRSAIIGVVLREDEQRRREFALASCRVTHTDPRAEESALLVSEAAALASMETPTSQALHSLAPLITSQEMITRFDKLKQGLASGQCVLDYAREIGCEAGVTGFAPNTVAVALFAWLRHRGQFDRVVAEVIACGGDTDSVAAIAGGICGAEVGESGIPKDWINDIAEWPRSVAYIRRVASSLATDHGWPASLFWPGVLARNLIFLVIVLLHGFRRLLPPY